jgi:hypothetical protein
MRPYVFTQNGWKQSALGTQPNADSHFWQKAGNRMPAMAADPIRLSVDIDVGRVGTDHFINPFHTCPWKSGLKVLLNFLDH